MAIPTKKVYGRNGKLIFDPSNPEDVRNYKEKQPLMEAFNLVRGVTDPRGGGGLFGMARKAASTVVSKAVAKETVKKAAKSTTKRSNKKITTTENKVEKPNLTLENLKKALNPSSGLPGPLPKVGSNKSLTTTNKSLTSNTPNSRTIQKTLPSGEESKAVIKTTTPKIKTISDFMKQQSEVITPLLPSVKTLPSGSKNISNTMELAQIPGSSAKTIKEGIKSFTGSTTRPGSTSMNYTPTDASKALSSIKEASKVVPKMPKEKLDIFSKLVLGTAGLGIAGGIGYQGYQGLTSKPIDLNNINENDLSDSTKYKDVKILKTSTGDKGIIKDPKTGKWKYFNEKEGVLKSGLAIGGGDGGGGSKSPNTGGGSGTTTPRSTTGQSFDKAFAEARKQAGGAAGIFEWNGKKYGTALKGETVPKDRVEVGKTTTPLMGDEEYKKDPRLATLRQQDDDRQLLARAEAQKKEMMEFKPTEVLPTKPLSSLVFKTTNRRDEQAALYNIEADNKLPLKKKRYGGNLAMLKYMK